MQNSLYRVYKLKIALLSIVTATLGLALLFLAKAAESSDQLAWLRDLPTFELGSTLFITGAFVVAYNYVDGATRTHETMRGCAGYWLSPLPRSGTPWSAASQSTAMT